MFQRRTEFMFTAIVFEMQTCVACGFDAFFLLQNVWKLFLHTEYVITLISYRYLDSILIGYKFHLQTFLSGKKKIDKRIISFVIFL